MAELSIKEIREEIQGDDSILVDPSAILVDGSNEFFSALVDALPKLKEVTLIIPYAVIDKVNQRLDSKVKRVADPAIAASVWLNKAVANASSAKAQVVVVGEPTGAFEDQTVLNQVSFLLPRHNVLLVTQNPVMTKKARALRDPVRQAKHKLHCCLVKPDGKLGLYKFPSDTDLK